MSSLISFFHNNAARFGRLDGETVTDLTASFDGRFASLSDAANAGALAELYAADGASVALADVTLTAPLPSPGKIICVGVNFPDRNAEYRDGQSAPANPSLFIRFPGSFVGHGDDLRRPPESEQLDYEGEIAIGPSATGSAMRNSMSPRARISRSRRRWDPACWPSQGPTCSPTSS